MYRPCHIKKTSKNACRTCSVPPPHLQRIRHVANQEYQMYQANQRTAPAPNEMMLNLMYLSNLTTSLHGTYQRHRTKLTKLDKHTASTAPSQTYQAYQMYRTNCTNCTVPNAPSVPHMPRQLYQPTVPTVPSVPTNRTNRTNRTNQPYQLYQTTVQTVPTNRTKRTYQGKHMYQPYRTIYSWNLAKPSSTDLGPSSVCWYDMCFLKVPCISCLLVEFQNAFCMSFSFSASCRRK